MNNFYSNPNVYDMLQNQDLANRFLTKLYNELFSDKDIKTIHDVSFGSGNLTIPLINMGYEVSGSDLSQEMLDKSKEKGLDIELCQADFRDLSCLDKSYDMVISTGNSLGHVSNEDVLVTLKEMKSKIKDGGYLYFDLRNWDNIIKTTQRFYPYRSFEKDGCRVDMIQVWDHNDDGSITFNIHYKYEKENKIEKTEVFNLTYYPLLKETIIEYLEGLGFSDIFFASFDGKGGEFDDWSWYTVIAKKATRNA